MSVTVTIRLNDVLVPVELDDDAVAAIAAVVATQSKPTPESPYLNVEQAAAYLCTSKQRVYDLLSARRIDRVKDGSRTLIRRSDLDAYLNNANRRRTP